MSDQYPMVMSGAPGNYGTPSSGYMSGAPTNYCMPILTQTDVAELYKKERIFEQQNLINQQQHNFKMEEIIFSEHCKLEREKVMEKRRHLWNESSISPVLDSRDRICIERSFTDGQKEISRPLFKYANLKVSEVKDIRTRNIICYIISWSSIKKKIIIKISEMTPACLFREMNKSGNPMLVGKNRVTELQELIYGYLLQQADTKYIPSHWGWYRDQNGKWHFNRESLELILKEGECDES